jgi:hypothetical protein
MINNKMQPYGFTKALQTWVLASFAQANLCFQKEMLATRGLGRTADEIVARAMLFQRRFADVTLDEVPLDRCSLETYMEERKGQLVGLLCGSILKRWRRAFK